MRVKRFAEARPYEAPNHRGVVGLRLQGFEDGGPTNQWVGLSQFLPGGGAGPDSTPFEKVYVVLDGEMTVIEDYLKKYNFASFAAYLNLDATLDPEWLKNKAAQKNLWLVKKHYSDCRR